MINLEWNIGYPPNCLFSCLECKRQLEEDEESWYINNNNNISFKCVYCLPIKN